MTDETTFHRRHQAEEPAPPEGPPPPPPPTPLDPPRVYYSIVDRVPPLVVFTKEAAEKLDPKLWITLPPVEDDPKPAKPQWPQLYYNVNVPPQVVGEEQAKTLGPEWQQFKLPQDLVKASTPDDSGTA